MGYNPWNPKESDTTQRLTLPLSSFFRLTRGKKGKCTVVKKKCTDYKHGLYRENQRECEREEVINNQSFITLLDTNVSLPPDMLNLSQLLKRQIKLSNSNTAIYQNQIE